MGPALPGGRRRRIPFPLFSLRQQDHGRRSRRKEMLERLSDFSEQNNGGLPTFLLLLCFLPPPRFLTPVLFPPPHPSVLSAGSSGQKGLSPGACHLLPAPTCLVALSVALILENLSHPSTVKIQHVSRPWTPSHNSQSHGHVG